jgi:hypothetical protein
MISGYLFFRIQALSQRAPAAPEREAERVVMVQSSSRETEQQPMPRPRQAARPATDPMAAELDRVLDKINEKGIGSLTAEERRFLDDFSRKNKPQSH